MTDRSGDELCLCVGVLPLFFHRYAIRIAQRNFATDAPETGAGICASTGVTKHGLLQAIIERETGGAADCGRCSHIPGPSLVQKI